MSDQSAAVGVAAIAKVVVVGCPAIVAQDQPPAAADPAPAAIAASALSKPLAGEGYRRLVLTIDRYLTTAVPGPPLASAESVAHCETAFSRRVRGTWKVQRDR
ncbi:MAG: hypothetical protein H0W72_12885 [Planctomycetes bacterium]|nr:hypothetical protein [Planctomycetota bacterium]